jgi:hypothetical protein
MSKVEFLKISLGTVISLLKINKSKTIYLASLNPSTTTRRYTATHFRWLFTVLEYSPISPTVRTKIESFQTFFVLKINIPK